MGSFACGDRFSGAGGAFRDAPLKAPENDAPFADGLAADEMDSDGLWPLSERSGVLGDSGGDLVVVTICASGADGPLTRGTGVVTLSAWPSSPLAMFTPVDGDVAAAVGDDSVFGPNGVSDRPGNGEAAPEGSLSLGLSKIPCRNTDCDAGDRVCSGSAGD